MTSPALPSRALPIHAALPRLVAVGLAVALSLDAATAPVPAQEVSFSKDVAPILVARCGNCHVRGRKGDFQMRSFAQLASSGKVSLGDSKSSPLIQMVASGEMPPRGDIPAAEVETLRKWVDSGAEFDGPDGSVTLTSLAKTAAEGSSAARGPVNRGDAEGYVAGGAGGEEMYSEDAGGGDMYSEDAGGGEMYGEEMEFDAPGGEDMYGEDMGGEATYGGGGRRGNASLMSFFGEQFAPSEPDALQALISPGDVSSGPVLARESELAFLAGNLPAAIQLYLGHMVAEYDNASEALESVRYSRALLRPVWHSRFGVSMMVRGDDTVEDFNPIEVGFATGRTRVASRGMRGRRGGGGAGGEIDYGEEMDYDEGFVGEEPMMEDYSEGEGFPGGRPPGSNRGGAPEAPQVEIKMLDDDARERLTNVLGLVAKKVEEEFGSRYRAGQFGLALRDVSETPVATGQPAPGQPGAAQPGAAQPGAARGPGFGQGPEFGQGRAFGQGQRRFAPGTAPRGGGAFGNRRGGPAPLSPLARQRRETMESYADPERPMWTPGVLFLGEGPSQETVKTAQQEGLDLLIHFDVAIKTVREDDVENLSRCRVVHVATGKTIGVSKAFDGPEAERLVDFERTSEAEYVTEKLQNLLDIVDDKLAVTEMPKLSPEVAKRRVASLLTKSGDPPLRRLAEIRVYQSQGLIADEDVESAFQIIAGDDGLVLLYGPRDERIEIVRRLVTAI